MKAGKGTARSLMEYGGDDASTVARRENSRRRRNAAQLRPSARMPCSLLGDHSRAADHSGSNIPRELSGLDQHSIGPGPNPALSGLVIMGVYLRISVRAGVSAGD